MHPRKLSLKHTIQLCTEWFAHGMPLSLPFAATRCSRRSRCNRSATGPDEPNSGRDTDPRDPTSG